MARPSVFTENSFKFSDPKNVRAFYKSDSGGKVDKKNLTQVGRALGQLGIMHIPADISQVTLCCEALTRFCGRFKR
jgi:hypothetical protein